MTEEKTNPVREIFDDFKRALTVDELDLLLRKLHCLKDLEDTELSYSTEVLCSRIFWHLDEIECEKNCAEFSKHCSFNA